MVTDKTSKFKNKYKNYPTLDVDALLFCDDNDINSILLEHTDKIRKKVLKKYLIPTVVVFSFVLVLCISISLYFFNYQHDALATANKQIEDLETKNNTLSEKVSELKEEVILTAIKSGLGKQITDTNNTNTLISQNAYTSSENTTPQERICEIPDCENTAARGSYYCRRHECSESGCHEPCVTDDCNYCENHKCAMPGCNSGQSLNSYYCFRHS